MQIMCKKELNKNIYSIKILNAWVRCALAMFIIDVIKDNIIIHDLFICPPLVIMLFAIIWLFAKQFVKS